MVKDVNQVSKADTIAANNARLNKDSSFTLNLAPQNASLFDSAQVDSATYMADGWFPNLNAMMDTTQMRNYANSIEQMMGQYDLIPPGYSGAIYKNPTFVDTAIKGTDVVEGNEEVDETDSDKKTTETREPLSKEERKKYSLFKSALGNWFTQDSKDLLRYIDKMSDEDIVAIASAYEKREGSPAALMRTLEKRIRSSSEFRPSTKRLMEAEKKIANALVKKPEYAGAALHEALSGGRKNYNAANGIIEKIPMMSDEDIAKLVVGYDKEAGESGALFKMLRNQQSTMVSMLKIIHPVNFFQKQSGITNIMGKSKINKLEGKIASAIAKNPKLAAQAMYSSMKGMGQNDHIIEEIAFGLDAKKDKAIIEAIMEEYEKISGRDIISAINNNYGGDREDDIKYIFEEVAFN